LARLWRKTKKKRKKNHRGIDDLWEQYNELNIALDPILSQTPSSGSKDIPPTAKAKGRPKKNPEPETEPKPKAKPKGRPKKTKAD